jgi:hypothetical protein
MDTQKNWFGHSKLISLNLTQLIISLIRCYYFIDSELLSSGVYYSLKLVFNYFFVDNLNF